MAVERVTSPDKARACFEVYLELRPHLKNREDFIKKMLLQQQEGFQLAAIFEGEEAVAAMGFRFMTTFGWGKILYIDDLTTKASFRGKGYGTTLLDYAIQQAKECDCDQVHLDSGYTRNKAHRLYLHYGFELTCHHFSLNRIFHANGDKEAAKPAGAMQANILKHGCMSTYCPSQNVSLTQHPSAFPNSAVDQYEISGLNLQKLP